MAKTRKKVTFQRPSVCDICVRILTLVILFAISVFLSATWFAGGLAWIMDSGAASTGTMPFLQCPSFFFNSQGVALNEGPRCRMSITYNDTIRVGIQGLNVDNIGYNLEAQGTGVSPNQCVVPGSAEETITCYSVRDCARSCIRYIFSDTAQTQLVSAEPCPDPAELETNDRSECTIIMAYSSDGVPSVFFTAKCLKVSVGSFCDSGYKVTPSNIVAIRGLLGGALLIVFIWSIGEIVLWSVESDLRLEAALGHEKQKRSLASKRKEFEEELEVQWEEEYQRLLYEGSIAGTASLDLSPRSFDERSFSAYSRQTGLSYQRSGEMRTSIDSRNPKRRFESSGWKRRLRQWSRLRADKKSLFSPRAVIRNLLLNSMFLVVLTVTMYVILEYSPNQVQGNNSLLDVLAGNASVWKTHSWLDFLIFVDVLLDVGLFALAVAVVYWPKPPVFTRHLNLATDQALKKVAKNEKKRARNQHIDDEREDKHKGKKVKRRAADALDDEEEIPLSLYTPTVSGSFVGSVEIDRTISSRSSEASLEFIVNQSLTADVCLMVACHESTLSEDKRKVFKRTLKSALLVFPPSHIFVCDNGNSTHPVDDTQIVARDVHPDINYLYIPEGNKTFAFYWCNRSKGRGRPKTLIKTESKEEVRSLCRYWIPYLSRLGRIPDFEYAIIIDDDVPLPADLHIPHEHLKQNPNIKAVHFPITAASPDGNPNLLVRCQDIEYKMAAVHKHFQSTMARTLSCHGAIALWDRDTMDHVFYHHDTVFHGEDLYMGLALLRMRDESKIISAPQSIVPTYAPDTWGMLFRQRVKSWELTSHKKTFTYLTELIHPWSIGHCASWALKPYFLQELLTIMLDWLRMFLLMGLLLRDWQGLCIMMAFYTFILYVQVLIFQHIYLRHRHDLKSSLSTVLFFPWYRLMSLIFRLCALCQNLLVYSKERKSVKIGIREDEIRDIPPCPPHPDVNWWAVWQVETPKVEKSRKDKGISLENDARNRKNDSKEKEPGGKKEKKEKKSKLKRVEEV